jgi:hypothetical protein
MRRLPTANFRRLNFNLLDACKIAGLASVIGLALSPRAGLAACPKICPQFLTAYCVMEPDGTISTVNTNPCFACRQNIRVLYMGACKTSTGFPRTCNGTTCS